MDKFLDWLIQHQVRLLQVAVFVQAEAQKELDQTEEEVGALAAALAAAILARGGAIRPDDFLGRRIIDQHIQAIATVRNLGFRRAFETAQSQLELLLDYEPQFLAAAAQPIRTLTLPPSLSSLASSTTIMGNTMDDWRSRLEANDLNRVVQNMRVGAGLGESAEAMRLRLLGHAAFGGTDGAFQAARNELDSLVRSALTSFADLARMRTMMENAEVKWEKYVAVLDSRTTDTCRGLNGRVFRKTEGPRPPLHFNCRSIRVPLVDGGSALTVPGYPEWLRRQDSVFQDEVLGKKDGAAFRDGNKEVTRFTERRWRGTSIQGLAAREGRVFENAGMTIPYQ